MDAAENAEIAQPDRIRCAAGTGSRCACFGDGRRRPCILGVPLYGYDRVGGQSTPVSWLQVLQLSEQYGVKPHFDAAGQSPWFGYTGQAGRRHVVWFENGPGTQAKFEAAESAGIGGVYVWIYGLEDTSIWTALRQSLPHRVPASSVWRPRDMMSHIFTGA